MNPILDRLKKIEALARSGIDGERESARAMLEALCKKHGVTLEQLGSRDTRPYLFRVSSDEERRVLVQLAVAVVGTRHVANRITKRRILFWLTPAQAVDVREAWDHYRPLWRSAVDDLVTAFANQHQLFAPDHCNATDSSHDAERWARIAAMMGAIPTTRPWKRKLRLTVLFILCLLGLR